MRLASVIGAAGTLALGPGSVAAPGRGRHRPHRRRPPLHLRRGL